MVIASIRRSLTAKINKMFGLRQSFEFRNFFRLQCCGKVPRYFAARAGEPVSQREADGRRPSPEDRPKNRISAANRRSLREAATARTDIRAIRPETP